MEVGAAGASAMGLKAAVGFLPGQTLGTDAGAGQPIGPGERGDVATDPGIEPRLTRPDVLRVHRQPLAERQPGGRDDRAEPIQRRPRAFGIDMVRSHRGHPTEVVDPGGQQVTTRSQVDEVRRCLDPHLRPEHDPGDGDRSQVLLQPQITDRPHRGVRLGPEVLDDHLLDVTVLLGQPPQREHRLRP
ncbi:MAG TPA: hypothetical protein VFG72_03170, partial [Marmoricola sp.]|nr:hypothetical protein [Marmoricola sp.]